MPTTTTTPTATTINETIDAWLATQPPDADLERLAAELGEAAAASADVLRRIAAVRSRRHDVAGRLLVLDDPERPALLAECVVLDAEAAALPVALRDAEQRRALCTLAVLRRVAQLAAAEPPSGTQRAGSGVGWSTSSGPFGCGSTRPSPASPTPRRD